jgi:hypothetical protein
VFSSYIDRRLCRLTVKFFSLVSIIPQMSESCLPKRGGGVSTFAEGNSLLPIVCSAPILENAAPLCKSASLENSRDELPRQGSLSESGTNPRFFQLPPQLESPPRLRHHPPPTPHPSSSLHRSTPLRFYFHTFYFLFSRRAYHTPRLTYRHSIDVGYGPVTRSFHMRFHFTNTRVRRT